MTSEPIAVAAPARTIGLRGLGTSLLDRPAGRVLLGLAPIVLAILAWWALTIIQDRPRVYPPPTLLLEELGKILGGTPAETGGGHTTWDHILATLVRLTAAFVASFIVGTALGILAGRIRLVFAFVENLVWVFMAVPSVIWMFIFVVALGISEFVPVLAVAALLTPMTLVTVAEGAKSIPNDILEMAASYKVTTRERVLGIFLPHLVPYLASAARTTFALGIKLIVVTEVVGLASGIGFEMKFWYGRLQMGPIIAWGIVLMVVGLVVDHFVFGTIERRVSRWKGRPGMEQTARSVG